MKLIYNAGAVTFQRNVKFLLDMGKNQENVYC